MTHDRTDVYTRITAEIVAAIEAGAGEFKMPWHHNGLVVTCLPKVTLRKVRYFNEL
jgi:antirestriction protein ArdC